MVNPGFFFGGGGGGDQLLYGYSLTRFFYKFDM